jgi:hypothetical protein
VVACASGAAFGQAGNHEEPLAITELELAGFNRIMGTTPSQHEAAQALADASKAELKQQEAEQAKIGEWFRNKPREQRTREDREKFLREFNAGDPDVAGARTKLFADLKSILTEEQRERWRKFEYFVRRETWRMRPPCVAVNVIALVDRLALDAGSQGAVADMLERYERELDPLLADGMKAAKETSELVRKVIEHARATQDLDMGDRQRAWDPLRRVNRYIVTLNDDCVRRIAAVIPEEQGKALREAYDRAALPEGLGIDGGNEAIRLAPDVPGLESATREKIKGMVREYAAKYDALSAKITVIERQLRLAQPGDVIDLTTWDPMRIERSELMGKTHQAIRDLLTTSQQEAMIRAGTKREREWRESMSR